MERQATRFCCLQRCCKPVVLVVVTVVEVVSAGEVTDTVVGGVFVVWILVLVVGMIFSVGFNPNGTCKS